MNTGIRTSPKSHCLLCNSAGELLHTSLRDRLFTSFGTWNSKRCLNPACRLIWLDPMPIEEDLHKAYESYYTHAPLSARSGLVAGLLSAVKRGYLANHFGYVEQASTIDRLLGLLPWLYPGRPPELDLSVMWLDASRRGKILDIGAGSGWLIDNLRSLGWDAEGLDFDPIAVENARVRGLRFHQGALGDQHFPDATFDAVSLCHSIEHVIDPVAILKECHRILKPGGSLAIATPNTTSLGRQIFGQYWLALDPPRHLHLFDKVSLGVALNQAGFLDTKLFTSCRDANGSYLASRSIARTGRHSMTTPSNALAALAGRLAQSVEIIAMLFDSSLGEDLVAIAKK